MNTLSKYFSLLFISMLFFSCYKDKSTVDTHNISEIKISLDDIKSSVVNIEKNETLTIDPVITQSGSDLALSYEWQIDYEVFSTDKKLVYVGNKLGSFPVRLKVTNKDGSAFKTFTLKVNSPYEEGLVVLGEKENGDGTMAFMRKYSAEEIAAGKVQSFENNSFERNNPGLTLGKGITDIAKREKQLFISSATDGKISMINTKTFELESVITAPDFPNFQPYRMNIPDNAAVSAIILSKDGKVYDIATKEYLILKNTKLPGGTVLDMKTVFVPGYNFNMNYYWDKTESRLWNLWYITTSTKNELAGQDMIQFFATSNACYILTRDKNDPSILTRWKFGPYLQVYFADPIELLEKDVFTNTAPTITENAHTVLNTKFNKYIYSNGNNIFSWFYSGTNLPTAPFITVDLPGEITGMCLSTDNNELYVGVYNAAASGLKGSVAVYNADNGSLINKYEGVTDKPVRLFYKKKD